MIWAAVTSATVFGVWSIGRTNKENRLNHKEQRECRFSVLPYLMVSFPNLSQFLFYLALLTSTYIVIDLDRAGFEAVEAATGKRCTRSRDNERFQGLESRGEYVL
jgi:hypothetical protein